MAEYGAGVGNRPLPPGESLGLLSASWVTEMPVHHLPLLTNLLVLTITLRGPAMVPGQTPHIPDPGQ